MLPSFASLNLENFGVHDVKVHARKNEATPNCFQEMDVLEPLQNFFSPEVRETMLSVTCDSLKLDALKDSTFSKKLRDAVFKRRLVVNTWEFLKVKRKYEENDGRELKTAIRTLKDLKEYSNSKTPGGKYVAYFLTIGPKITVQIDNSKSLDVFMAACNEIHEVAPSCVMFALGHFFWLLNFSSFNSDDEKKVLLRIEKICDIDKKFSPQNRNAESDADMSLLKNLRYIGKRAGYLTNGNVNLSGCTSLTTIGEEAFLYAKGYVNLKGCSSLETIGKNAFNMVTGYVNLSGCTSLKMIGEKAFPNAIGSVDLSGCTSLETIGKNALWRVTGYVNLSGCTSLKTIAIDAFPGAIGSVDLSGCTSLTTIGKSALWRVRGYVNLSGCTS